MCQFFAEGKCWPGDVCRYAHVPLGRAYGAEGGREGEADGTGRVMWARAAHGNIVQTIRHGVPFYRKQVLIYRRANAVICPYTEQRWIDMVHKKMEGAPVSMRLAGGVVKTATRAPCLCHEFAMHWKTA